MIRTFIWGSCVARDTFEYLPSQEFTLLRYVARQSAVSAASRPVSLVEPPKLPSAFQHRMLVGDFASNLRAELAVHTSTDLVLLDLVDERLGVYVLPDDTVLTRSLELIQSNIEARLPEGTRYLKFGTPEHYERWSASVEELGGALCNLVPDAKVVLLDVPWAQRSASGAETPRSFGVSAADANPRFRPYVVRAVEALGAHLVSLQDRDVTADDNHVWGLAPFHYTAQVYEAAVERLVEICKPAVGSSAVREP
jgi:hypothetical protein